MTNVERYQVSWDRYWHETMELADMPEQARSIWENDWRYAAEKDLPRLKEWMTTDVPLIDFGCGNGRQTQYFAPHFTRIIGTDVSASAIALANRQYAAPNIQYRVLDAFDTQGISRLHAELGDVNIYMRTVLHQIARDDRPRFVEGVKGLLGKTGTLYLYELGAAAEQYIGSFIQRHGVPDKLQRILNKGMSPGPVGRADVDALFAPEFEVVTDGNDSSFGGFRFPLGPNGEDVDFSPPTYYAIVRRAK